MNLKISVQYLYAYSIVYPFFISLLSLIFFFSFQCLRDRDNCVIVSNPSPEFVQLPYRVKFLLTDVGGMVGMTTSLSGIDCRQILCEECEVVSNTMVKSCRKRSIEGLQDYEKYP